jgi:hypothetical protein
MPGGHTHRGQGVGERGRERERERESQTERDIKSVCNGPRPVMGPDVIQTCFLEDLVDGCGASRHKFQEATL